MNSVNLQDKKIIYRNILCIYTLKTIRKIKKAFLFTIALKITKYVGITLTKEVKDLHMENYNILMKETGDAPNVWKDTMIMNQNNNYRFFFPFGCICRMWTFQGQGLNQSHSSEKARSLNH